MEYRVLNNGVKMPKLGLGTFLSKDGQEAYEAVKYALEVGYRLIDTAQMYKNEESVGRAIVDSKVNRKEIFITTKLVHHAPRVDILKSVDISLEKLKTNYLDLLLIHWPNSSLEVNLETWRVFEELYDKGIVRAIGVSNFTQYHLEHLLKHAKVKPVINQVELHPGLQQYALEEYLNNHGIALQSYGPFMRGRLNEEPFKERLESIAAKHNVSVNQVIIAWGLKRNILMIPKSVTSHRILENFKSKSLVLDQDDLDLIKRCNRGLRLYSDPDNTPWGPFKEIDFIDTIK